MSQRLLTTSKLTNKDIAPSINFVTPTVTTKPASFEYLLVAGGGSGGNAIGTTTGSGGGGGAGGLLTGSSLTGPNLIINADASYNGTSGWNSGATDYTGTTGAFSFGGAGSIIQSTQGGARTIALPEGSFYFEYTLASVGFILFGLARDSHPGGYNKTPSIYTVGGVGYGGLTGGTDLGTFTTSDVLQIAYNSITNKVYFGKNNTWYLNPSVSSGTTIPGQGSLRFLIMSASTNEVCTGTFKSPANNTYEPPTGYNKICTPGFSLSVSVGAGGSNASGTNTTLTGTNFTSLTAVGGGKGGNNRTAGTAGGSGGGAGGPLASGAGGAGTSGQGFAGGSQGGSSGGGCGGGGAAETPGAQATLHRATNGGNGALNSLTGIPTYYAGGGGGGQYTTFNIGLGGLGGGGSGLLGGTSGVVPPTPGLSNTGGGGGGGAYASSTVYNSGASGGSGITVIRTLVYDNATGVEYTAPSHTNAISYKWYDSSTNKTYQIYIFLTSGTITF